MAETDKTFVTKPVRCGYVNVFRPRKNMNKADDAPPDYSLQMILDKDKDAELITEIQRAVDDIFKKLWPKGAPAKAWNPLIDAQEDHEAKGKPLPEYLANCYTLNVKNVRKPGIVDRDRMDVIDETAFQSGDYARVHFNLFGFQKGTGGVSASLQNVLIWDKGEPLGSTVRPEDAFGASDDEEDWAA